MSGPENEILEPFDPGGQFWQGPIEKSPLSDGKSDLSKGNNFGEKAARGKRALYTVSFDSWKARSKILIARPFV